MTIETRAARHESYEPAALEAAGRAPSRRLRASPAETWLLDLQRSAGNRVVSQLISSNVVQRTIGFDRGRFTVLDPDRPRWAGALSGNSPPGKSKNHVIPFSVIQADLVHYLNELQVAVENGARTDKAEKGLKNLVHALYPHRAGSPYKTVHAALHRTIDAIKAKQASQQVANDLLNWLNSDPENVGLGDRSTNISASDNIDADFLPGTSEYTGEVEGGLAVKAKTVLLLEKESNTLVYSYYGLTTTNKLNFVLREPDKLQVSSGDAPAPDVDPRPKGIPVLVLDPSDYPHRPRRKRKANAVGELVTSTGAQTVYARPYLFETA